MSTWLSLAFVGVVLTVVWRFVCPLIRVARLSDRFVLITGCDSGFGRAAALRLQARGMKVLAACLTDAGLKSLQADAVRNGPGSLVCVSLDVTKDASVAAAVETIKKALNGQPLHAIINNAGVLRGGLCDTVPVSDWILQLEVNVLGIARITKPLIPLLFAGNGESRIINVASVAGIFATDGTSAYNASKFAVVGLTDAMRRELAAWGIQVGMILPGIMKTELWSQPLSADSQNKTFASLTADQKTFYGGPDYFAKAYDEARGLVNLVGGNPEKVVDAMEELSTAKWVATRRYVGHDTWAFRLLSALPDVIADKMWASRHIVLRTEPVLPKGVLERK
jgi:NAD(P)-dependent dehydrogenase (short-subunit alcohol dehydrogenase family)